MNTISSEALLTISIMILVCSPVSAYSAGAVDLYTTGTSLMEAGNYSGAYAQFTRAVSLEPRYFEAWNGIADVLNRDGQSGEALEASNRSLEINPNYVQGWINRGQILYNIGYYYEDVAGDLTKADALYAEQLAAFEKAVSLDPGNAEAVFNKGYALAGMKRYDEAIAAFDRVYAIDPSYPNLLKNREIAVQLREMSSPAPSGPAVAASTPPVPVRLPQTTAPTPSTPLSAGAVVIALTGAVLIVIWKR